MKTSALNWSTPKAAYEGGGIYLATVDCEICERQFVPHLLDLANGDKVGLCTEHLGDYPRLYLESTSGVVRPPPV